MKNDREETITLPEVKPFEAPSVPDTKPSPRENPFAPSIEPETTPKG